MSNHPLANRLSKRMKHLKKWAKRQAITCFRLYHNDLSEYLAIMDYYDGTLVMWVYNEEQTDVCIDAVKEGLGLNRSKIIVKHRGKQKGLQTQYEKVADQSVINYVHEQGLTFEVNLSDYLDTGLFLDHRQARKYIQSISFSKSVLNLYAYTGSFSCYAAAGGATTTTTIDLNPNYCKWAQRNLVLNGFLNKEQHSVESSDCIRFLNHCRDQYDIVVVDPPTFSNSKRGSTETFSINEDYPMLLQLCLKVLRPGGVIFFSTNSKSFKLNPDLIQSDLIVQNITSKTVPEDFKGSRIHQSWTLRVLSPNT